MEQMQASDAWEAERPNMAPILDPHLASMIEPPISAFDMHELEMAQQSAAQDTLDRLCRLAQQPQKGWTEESLETEYRESSRALRVARRQLRMERASNNARQSEIAQPEGKSSLEALRNDLIAKQIKAGKLSEAAEDAEKCYADVMSELKIEEAQAVHWRTVVAENERAEEETAKRIEVALGQTAQLKKKLLQRLGPKVLSSPPSQPTRTMRAMPASTIVFGTSTSNTIASGASSAAPTMLRTPRSPAFTSDTQTWITGGGSGNYPPQVADTQTWYTGGRGSCPAQFTPVKEGMSVVGQSRAPQSSTVKAPPWQTTTTVRASAVAATPVRGVTPVVVQAAAFQGGGGSSCATTPAIPVGAITPIQHSPAPQSCPLSSYAMMPRPTPTRLGFGHAQSTPSLMAVSTVIGSSHSSASGSASVPQDSSASGSHQNFGRLTPAPSLSAVPAVTATRRTFGPPPPCPSLSAVPTVIGGLNSLGSVSCTSSQQTLPGSDVVSGWLADMNSAPVRRAPKDFSSLGASIPKSSATLAAPVRRAPAWTAACEEYTI